MKPLWINHANSQFAGYSSVKSDLSGDPDVFLEKKCQFFRVHSVGFISVFNSGSHSVLHQISRTSGQIYKYAAHGMAITMSLYNRQLTLSNLITSFWSMRPLQ